MFATTHPPIFNNNYVHKDRASPRKHLEMASEERHQIQKYTVNEQGEHAEEKMSVNCLLNNPIDIIHIRNNNLHASAIDIARVSDYHANKDTNERPSSYDDQYIEYIEGSPPTTPTVNACLPQRAPCSVCKSETGRCHASDPGRFDGVLNVADWLCMKCYSKWYNRCKRKASSALAMTMVDPSLPLPQQKRKRREKDKDNLLPKVDGEKKDSDRDTDSDDALLLARIGGSFSVASSSGSVNTEEVADLDSASVEELRAEVTRLRKDMRKMVTDASHRDEQIEGMLSFVRGEVTSMHSMLKDIYSAKWGVPAPSLSAGPSPASSPIMTPSANHSPLPTNLSSLSSNHPSNHPAIHPSNHLSNHPPNLPPLSNSHPSNLSCLSSNNLPSLSSLPLPSLSSFSVPSLHS